MSDFFVRRVKPFMAGIPATTWEKALKYGVAAIITGIGWSVVVASLSWLSGVYRWSTTGRWSDLWLLGLAAIATVCGTCFGVSVTSTPTIDGAASANGTAAQLDRLEVRALSWMLGNHVNAEAWRALTSHRPDTGRKSDVNDRAPADADGPVPLSPFSQAFKRIADDLPRNVPVPLLVWPEQPNDDVMRDLALAGNESRNYGLSYAPQSAVINDEYQDAIGAAFSIFDTQAELSHLLVLSADGPGFRSDALPGVAPNVSFLLLARPRCAQQGLTPQQSQEPAVSADTSPLLGFVHRPCTTRLPGALGHVTSDDSIRATWQRATTKVSGIKAVERVLLAGAGSWKLRPLVRELLDTSTETPDGIEQVIDVTDSKPSLGAGSSAGWLAYAIEAMIESGSVVATTATVTENFSITLVSTRASDTDDENP